VKKALIRTGIIILVYMVFPVLTWAGSPVLELAWKQEGSPRYCQLREDGNDALSPDGVPLDPNVTTSLGSLWKLFIYAYVAAGDLDAPEYICTGSDPKEEAFCCTGGNSIGADDALALSCGLFFEPSRLKIANDKWHAFWNPIIPASAQWLGELSRLRPDTEVSVASLLDALEAIPLRPRLQAEHALMRILFNGRAEGTVRYLGGRLRVKTWTWGCPGEKGGRAGGFAGWLPDGTVVWGRSEGPSTQILRQWASRLSAWIDTLPVKPEEKECVVVNFFAAYPLKQVIDLQTGQPVRPGILDGAYRAEFRNGNRVRIASHGELNLAETTDGLRVTGRLGLNDYVARVLEREAATAPAEAAKALAIAVRTYLFQNAAHRLGCYEIDDSSRRQRVSPNPPGDSALRIATWTDSLVVKGAPVNYNFDQPGRNRLAWTQAVDLARGGETFDRILADVYPAGGLGSIYADMERDCHRMEEAETWLLARSQLWKRALAGEPGFEPPPADLAVCRLKEGNPYSDFDRRRIYARELKTVNDRIAIAHEYVHLGFRRHPRGGDERFVERTARKLLGE
jgi:uncharacterized protein YfaQ (DUF2300 family)